MVHCRRFAQAYVVDVQALSIHAYDNLVSLSFLQATVTEHRRRIDAAVFRIQWLGKRCDRIRRLHNGHIGGSKWYVLLARLRSSVSKTFAPARACRSALGAWRLDSHPTFGRRADAESRETRLPDVDASHFNLECASMNCMSLSSPACEGYNIH
jgi:hypothetical protein